MTLRVKSSPCVGLCSTTYGDLICRGCFRNLDEVLYWRQKSPQEQVQYYQRLSAQSRNILMPYWTIHDSADFLDKMLSDSKIFVPPSYPPCAYFSLVQLIQSGINPMTHYACYITWNTQPMPITQLARLVSQFLYVANENIL